MLKKIISIFLLLLFVFFGWLSFNLWWAKRNLEGMKKDLLAGNFERAERKASASFYAFKRVKINFSLIPILDDVYQLGEKVDLGETLAESGIYLARAGKWSEKAIKIILGEEEGNLQKVALTVNMDLGLAWRNLSLIASHKKEGWLPEITEIRRGIKVGQALVSVLPQIFPKEKRSYLFLLQNNMELRATGGFIGSYALAIFENHKLLDFQVNDVYTADGQLRGHVEPPAAIKRYLGEANWYLRDSNFEPDFPQASKKAAWFFQKETDRMVDGVIGLNLYLVEKILKAIGPVKLPDYQETITAENLFERAEYHSEVGFFPGSTQKRDFLACLTDQIFQKLKRDKNWLKIARAVWESLEEKQVLVFFNDQQVQAIFKEFNWDGAIRKAPDYLLVVDSNFGVNKVNYFLKRNLRYEVELKEEESQAKLTIDYQNNSPSQVWPGGVYRNYLRVYTPLGSKLLKVKINGQTVDLNQIEISSSFQKTVFAFFLEVPVQERKIISFEYQLPLKINQPKFSYSLLWQKQSGTDKDPLSVLVSFPSSFQVVNIFPDALTGPQTILYNTDLSKDRVFKIDFIK